MTFQVQPNTPSRTAFMKASIQGSNTICAEVSVLVFIRNSLMRLTEPPRVFLNSPLAHERQMA